MAIVLACRDENYNWSYLIYKGLYEDIYVSPNADRSIITSEQLMNSIEKMDIIRLRIRYDQEIACHWLAADRANSYKIDL